MLHSRKDYQERIQDSAGLIPEGEPVFFVRAQDVTAPEVVKFWAELAKEYGALPNIITAAREHMERMIEWQREHGMKIPDMPEECDSEG